MKGAAELPHQAPPPPASHVARACPLAGAVARLASRLERAEDDLRDLWLAAGLALVLAVVAAVAAVCALVVAW